MCVDINTLKLNGLKEYVETGEIANNGEGFAIFGDDIEALDTIPYVNGLFYPQAIHTVGYADLGEDHTTTIRMCGREDETYHTRQSIEIGTINDNYLLDRFHSGMSDEDVREELAEMVMNKLKDCYEYINTDEIDMEELKDSMSHPIRIVDKYLNNGQFELSQKQPALDVHIKQAEAIKNCNLSNKDRSKFTDKEISM